MSWLLAARAAQTQVLCKHHCAQPFPTRCLCAGVCSEGSRSNRRRLCTWSNLGLPKAHGYGCPWGAAGRRDAVAETYAEAFNSASLGWKLRASLGLTTLEPAGVTSQALVPVGRSEEEEAEVCCRAEAVGPTLEACGAASLPRRWRESPGISWALFVVKAMLIYFTLLFLQTVGR